MRLEKVVLVLFVVAAFTARGAEDVRNWGPTGLRGTAAKNTIQVAEVSKLSPADGKLKKGDTITGINGKAFKNDVRWEFAAAIDRAETESMGGKLALTLKGGKEVQLQLTVLGTYSPTAPYDCPKSKAIITRAADALVMEGKVDRGATHSGLLGLMATGEKKYIDVVTETIRNADWAKPNGEEIEALFRGEKDLGYVGWYWGYNLITLAEYYLLTGDKSVLPAIRLYAVSLARGQDAGGLWNHRMILARTGRLKGYGQMNQPSLSNFIGMLMAKKCGIDDPVLDKGIATTYTYVASHVGKGSFKYGVHGPNSGVYNNNGTSGSAALCMALKGNLEGAKFFSQLSATSYDDLEQGHADNFFNPFWTPLGAALSGPEVTQPFFRNSLWFFNLNRNWDGSFSGDSKAGAMDGAALLLYCIPRKAILITGREADESIWQKGKAATDVIMLSKIDYKSKSTEELMAMAMDHALPQVRRGASGALVERKDSLASTWLKYFKEGTPKQKQLAIEQYGWWIPIEVRLPQLDAIGAILHDPQEPLEVRVTAAGSVAYMGEAAQKYYMDIVGLIALDKPSDPLGLTDMGLGNDLDVLCKDPFKSGLVTDKITFYKAAFKLLDNKRQGGRESGLNMLGGMPLEDFYLVADKVVHVIEDKDPTYHSYHNPTQAVAAGVTLLANLHIKEGIQYALDIQKLDAKGSFEMLAIMNGLAAYGANAKAALELLKTQDGWSKVPENKKFKKNWQSADDQPWIEDVRQGERFDCVGFSEGKRVFIGEVAILCND